MKQPIKAILISALAIGLTITGIVLADPPRIYSQDGKYLGRLSTNPYGKDSTGNPYSKYGSPYQEYSINNPYGKYGSIYSNQSSNNPYATEAPIIIGDE